MTNIVKTLSVTKAPVCEKFVGVRGFQALRLFLNLDYASSSHIECVCFLLVSGIMKHILLVKKNCLQEVIYDLSRLRR